jgi:hypothetical protein
MCENTTPLAILSKTEEFEWEPFYLSLYKVLPPEFMIGPNIINKGCLAN